MTEVDETIFDEAEKRIRIEGNSMINRGRFLLTLFLPIAALVGIYGLGLAFFKDTLFLSAIYIAFADFFHLGGNRSLQIAKLSRYAIPFVDMD